MDVEREDAHAREGRQEDPEQLVRRGEIAGHHDAGLVARERRQPVGHLRSIHELHGRSCLPHGVRRVPGRRRCVGSVRSRPSLERLKGIEPSSSDWKSEALPLSYSRVCVGHRL